MAVLDIPTRKSINAWTIHSKALAAVTGFADKMQPLVSTLPSIITLRGAFIPSCAQANSRHNLLSMTFGLKVTNMNGAEHALAMLYKCVVAVFRSKGPQGIFDPVMCIKGIIFFINSFASGPSGLAIDRSNTSENPGALTTSINALTWSERS